MKTRSLMKICLVVVILLLIVSANVRGGVIADPCLWLQFEGADGQATTVDSSIQNHSVSFFGNAQLDTAYQKVGNSSLLLDGTGDYATLPDSADWDILTSNTDDWTIDFYVRQDGYSGNECYLSHGTGPSNPRWYLYYNTTEEKGLAFIAGPSHSTTTISMSPQAGTSDEISDSEWHWIVFAKVGTEYALYLDGAQVNYTLDNDNVDASGELKVGQMIGFAGANLGGNMDELRIFHCNVFGAVPNSGLTDTIIIPEPATIALLGIGMLFLKRRSTSKEGR